MVSVEGAAAQRAARLEEIIETKNKMIETLREELER
jgi:hypothetical protein